VAAAEAATACRRAALAGTPVVDAEPETVWVGGGRPSIAPLPEPAAARAGSAPPTWPAVPAALPAAAGGDAGGGAVVGVGRGVAATFAFGAGGGRHVWAMND